MAASRPPARRSRRGLIPHRRSALAAAVVSLAAGAALTACGGGGGAAGSDAERIVAAISAAQEQADEAVDAAADEVAQPGADDPLDGAADEGATDDGGSAEQGPGPGSVATLPAPEVRRWDVEEVAWWDGFEITVGSVEATGDDARSSVVVDVSFLNQGPHIGRVASFAVQLTVDGQAFPIGFSTPPEVPAGGRNDASLDFEVDGPFEVERAALTFGAPDQNQTVIPLGGGEVQTFEPMALEIDGDLTAGHVAISFAGPVEVTASYEIGERGVHVVRVPVEMRSTSDLSSGTLVLPVQFTIATPDGQTLASTPLGGLRDLVAEPLYADQAPVRYDLAFRLTELAPGAYTVEFTADDGSTASATFEVPA